MSKTKTQKFKQKFIKVICKVRDWTVHRNPASLAVRLMKVPTKGTNFYYQSNLSDTYKAMRKTLGVHLFRLRQARKLTIKDLSKKIGVGEKAVDMVEIGKGGIDGSVAGKMLDYFGLRVRLELVSRLPEQERVVVQVIPTVNETLTSQVDSRKEN